MIPGNILAWVMVNGYHLNICAIDADFHRGIHPGHGAGRFQAADVQLEPLQCVATGVLVARIHLLAP